MRDHPASFRRSISEIEEWLINGEVRKDESELGRALSDLQSLDSNGRIKIDGEAYILAFGRHRGKDLLAVEREDPQYVNWLTSPKGIEDELARQKILELISSIRNR